ncbi:MAG TPA: ISAs1 family transposase [Pyrinomonadaceae bacterium]|nr:ISAs1 family transposase [Pyrinomonadaceae bacterium]
MIAHPRPLIEVLADIPECRANRGKRHPLAAMLALACSAMLCGYRSYTAIAEWGRNYGTPLVQALGFTRQPPCAATFHTVLHRIDRDALEATLGAWAEALLRGTAAPQDTVEAMAIDGKTLRGSKKQGAPGAHLLSALAHRVGLTLAQQAVADKTNEIPVAVELLRHIVLEGRVVTMDALLTQRAIARQIVEAGGDYVMCVKDNQPQLREEITTVFAHAPRADETRTVAETVDVGHGRIEQRHLQTSDVLAGYSAWPGLAQVFQVERQVIVQKTGEVRKEVVVGVTSLPLARADAGQLLALVRGHWKIENQSHWVRDVTFDEDRSQVRCGSIPQVMAALRNTVIGLMRWAGYTNMAAACRRLAAQPALALALIGIELEN